MVQQISRRTRQKSIIRKELEESRDFISAQDLHTRLSSQGSGIGLATVYRQLHALAKTGLADTIQHDGRQLFRLCDARRRHHHHLVCERCGKTVEIAPPDEAWLTAVAKKHGFTVSSHTVEVFGLCPDCQRAEREATARANHTAVTNAVKNTAAPLKIL